MSIPEGYAVNSEADVEALEEVTKAAVYVAREYDIQALAVVVVFSHGGVTSAFAGTPGTSALVRLLAKGPESLQTTIERAFTGEGGKSTILGDT